MNDPLSFQNAISKTNLSDLLIIYLFKYKNPVIMNFFEQISRFQNIIYNFDEFNKNLDDDEKEFVKVYSNTNRFLMKYLPINLIYVYYSHDFNELMKLIFQDNIRSSSLIWNKEMLESLIQSLVKKFESFIKVDLKNYYFKINFEKESEFLNFPKYCFEENYRFIYKEINCKTKAFIYYLDIYINKNNKSISDKEDKNNTILTRNNSSVVKKPCVYSNNMFEDHIQIVFYIIIDKISKIKEKFDYKSELYSNELLVYFKSFLKLIKSYIKN